MQYSQRLWIGLPILVGLVYFAADALTREVEADLSTRATAALATVGKGAIEGVGVAVSGRDATLTGVALSKTGVAQALTAIGGIEGVRVALDGTTPPAAVHPFVLTLTRSDRRVTLDGHYPPDGPREQLRAELAKLGLQIVDHGGYASGAPASFDELARFAARQLAQLDEGVAVLTDAALSLKGVASPQADFDKLLAAAHAPPKGTLVAKLAIEPAHVAPYVWGAERSGGDIKLTGFVPSAEARERIVERARTIVDKEMVVDQMRFASGAPVGDFTGAAEAALLELRALAHGKVAFEDAKLKVEGEGKADVVAASLADETRRRLPPGFEVAGFEVADGPAAAPP